MIDSGSRVKLKKLGDYTTKGKLLSEIREGHSVVVKRDYPVVKIIKSARIRVVDDQGDVVVVNTQNSVYKIEKIDAV